MQISAEIVDFRTARPQFRTARSAASACRSVILRIDHDGRTGLGEAKPSEYYGGETPEKVLETVAAARELLGNDPFLLENITQRLNVAFPHAHAARCAIDMALHDLVGQLLGVPVYRLLGLSSGNVPPTSFTIGLDEPEVMAEQASEVRGFKVLKVKIGTERDAERISAIRSVTSLPLRVDANTGWTPEAAVEALKRLSGLGIEFCEQPIPPGDPEAMKYVKLHSPVPIMADESAVNLADLPALVGCVDAINIKLMKCGGIREALRMIHFARANGMKIMLGCMLETTLGITAAVHLSPLVDYVDLDGNLLIADDPFVGATLSDGRQLPPDAPGLGVRYRSAVAAEK